MEKCLGFKTKKELCKEYGISISTLNSKLAEIKNKLGKHKGYYFNSKQVKIIYEYLGNPNTNN